jgi:ribonuclease HII
MPTQTKSRPRRKRNRAPQRVRELALLDRGLVAGVDEVGRGAWAGPLVAAAVVLEPEYRVRKVYDSKQMTRKAREQAARRIRHSAKGIGVGVVEVTEMNQFGFTWALQQAGLRAVRDLPESPDHVLLDGHHAYLEEISCETIVHGDAKELCIAAASVIAKVHRDQMMRQLDRQFRSYGFRKNMGYGTAYHRRKLQYAGPCAAHRMRWQPIHKLMQQELPV